MKLQPEYPKKLSVTYDRSGDAIPMHMDTGNPIPMWMDSGDPIALGFLDTDDAPRMEDEK